MHLKLQFRACMVNAGYHHSRVSHTQLLERLLEAIVQAALAQLDTHIHLGQPCRARRAQQQVFVARSS